jgi:hypothetical protein
MILYEKRLAFSLAPLPWRGVGERTTSVRQPTQLPFAKHNRILHIQIKYHMRNYLLPALFLLLFAACHRGATHYDFPVDVDTTTKEITLQTKQDWNFVVTGLIFDNQFDGARLNEVTQEATNLYRVKIEPENTPINSSPWYAFRIKSERDKNFTVHLTYGNGANHRYYPKISRDRRSWVAVDTSKVIRNVNGFELYVSLEMKAGETLYLAGQEVINSSDVKAWAEGLAQHPNLSLSVAGQSKLGRDIYRMDLRTEGAKKRPTIVLLSRQHPPEVTGFLALQGFINGLLAHPRLNEFLSEYQVLIYPLLNPDGVDLGHWRHTAAGIDSNRDWAQYNQPEAYTVANDIVRIANEYKSKVVLGMDFHSTYKDVYYTHLDEVKPATALPGFKDAWLAGIEKGIGGDFKINEDAEVIGKPTTMSWFRTQFGAEGITYEIGDGTDREFVERKGRISADVMVELLVGSKE